MIEYTNAEGQMPPSFPSGSRVLDIGCGRGQRLADLQAQGCKVVGVDIAVPANRSAIPFVLASAEALPFKAQTFDGGLSRVMLPYVHDRVVMRELSRVCKVGSTIQLITHGLGYYLAMTLGRFSSFKGRIYGVRTILNTLLYRLTKRRFLGDTIFHSHPALSRLAGRYRWQIVRTLRGRSFLRCPVFLYYVLRHT